MSTLNVVAYKQEPSSRLAFKSKFDAKVSVHPGVPVVNVVRSIAISDVKLVEVTPSILKSISPVNAARSMNASDQIFP